jgi:mRNA interferase RelE/StbE
VKTIVFTESAAKQLGALPLADQHRIEGALDRYAITGHGDVKRLTGCPEYRLKVGNYRVIFDQDATTIVAIYVGRRRTGTYKRN